MITSKTNDLIKYIKSLSLKKNRDESGDFIVEGIKMVNEVVLSDYKIKKILICEELLGESFDARNNEVEFVSKVVFEYISDTKTPQGIMAVVSKKETSKVVLGENIFALDNVQDPGNLGTIIRTLDCAGINTLLLSKGCADEYNTKVIRSTMGAIFRVNILSDLELKEELEKLKEDGYNLVVTSLEGATSLFEHKFSGKNVIVIGNESNGVSKEIQEIANVRIKIPMVGQTESLNAGVAASLMAYEVLRTNSMDAH
ncbi:MAG: RNA methyltransferase [Clostridia bacterium]|nr:RNA methyltransferase [Clostridia bacterium]